MLDIGAAQGANLIALSEMGHRPFCIELWESALVVAQQLAAKERRAISIQKGMAEAIPFADESFDVAMAPSVIEHVEDLGLALSDRWQGHTRFAAKTHRTAPNAVPPADLP